MLQVLIMILIFSFFLLLLLFMNFSLYSNKVNIYFIIKVFIEIKSISYFFIKLILAILLFFLLNYNRYIYYSVGLSIYYGYVFIYALCIVFLLWRV